MFDPDSWQVLQHYVYALFDPNDGGKPFHIGKGCGNRVFDHIKGAALVDDDDDLMSRKVETIKDITARGATVSHKILRYGMSREEALKVEATAIDLVNLMHPGTLTNRVSGHGVAEGIIDTDDLQTAVNARPLVSDLPLLVIKIERKWPEMVKARGGSTSAVTQDDVYEAVKGDWAISLDRAKPVSCVLAVAGGIVRGVVVPQGWENAGYDRRKRMTGCMDASEFQEFINSSVAHLTSSGNQNPIRYL